MMRLLGIDYGARRIGLALSDASATLATPWRSVAARGRTPAIAAGLVKIIVELQSVEDGLAAVVIGLPRRLDGQPNEQTQSVRALVAEIAQRSDIPLILQDERLTSREAESRLAVRDRNWRSRKSKIDAAAAAIILQDYLDGQADPAPRPDS
jgi:putative Holliday junction resolvase